MPTYVPRSEWGLLEPKQIVDHPVTSRGEAVSVVVLHHSVTSQEPFIRVLQAIERFHINGDFFDFAYNGAASNSSDQYAEGRGALVQGGATGNGVDSYSLSICAIGSFHQPDDKRFHEITQNLIDNVATYIVDWIRQGYVARNYVLQPHRDFYQTSCCGDALFARIPDIVARVDELLEDGGGAPDVIPMIEWDNHFRALPDFHPGPDGVVEWYQDGLIVLGYDVGSDGIDGIKGPNTRAAWLQFETDIGVENPNDKPGNYSTRIFREMLREVGEDVEVPVPVTPPGLQAEINEVLNHASAAKIIADSYAEGPPD